uniref:Uncharacterized protein n=1 Tax=Clastoptera arizonana TaxID=38151 RepID=A0A1B6EAH1_9HEMI
MIGAYSIIFLAGFITICKASLHPHQNPKHLQVTRQKRSYVDQQAKEKERDSGNFTDTNLEENSGNSTDKTSEKFEENRKNSTDKNLGLHEEKTRDDRKEEELVEERDSGDYTDTSLEENRGNSTDKTSEEFEENRENSTNKNWGFLEEKTMDDGQEELVEERDSGDYTDTSLEEKSGNSEDKNSEELEENKGNSTGLEENNGKMKFTINGIINSVKSLAKTKWRNFKLIMQNLTDMTLPGIDLNEDFEAYNNRSNRCDASHFISSEEVRYREKEEALMQIQEVYYDNDEGKENVQNDPDFDDGEKWLERKVLEIRRAKELARNQTIMAALNMTMYNHTQQDKHNETIDVHKKDYSYSSDTNNTNNNTLYQEKYNNTYKIYSADYGNVLNTNNTINYNNITDNDDEGSIFDKDILYNNNDTTYP